MGETTGTLTRRERVVAGPGGPEYGLGWRWLDRQFARLAVLPTALVMLVVFGLPLLFSLYLSLQGWSIDQCCSAARSSGSTITRTC